MVFKYTFILGTRKDFRGPIGYIKRKLKTKHEIYFILPHEDDEFCTKYKNIYPSIHDFLNECKTLKEIEIKNLEQLELEEIWKLSENTVNYFKENILEQYGLNKGTTEIPEKCYKLIKQQIIELSKSQLEDIDVYLKTLNDENKDIPITVYYEAEEILPPLKKIKN